MRRLYTTLWDINVRKQQQPETCIMLNSTLQRSVATWFRCSGTFDQYFIANVLLNLFLKEISKSFNIWQRYEKSWRDLFKFWEVTDNISEMVQDRHIATMEDE